MLMTVCTEQGEQRVYISRFASVVTYFTADDDGGGVTLHVEPGPLAFDCAYARTADAVRQAVIAHVAGRLGVAPAELLAASFATLKELADAPLPAHYRYARRSQNRAYPRS